MNFQIPDEAYAQLEALLEREGGIQWEVGDFIADFWQEMQRYLKPEEEDEAHAKLIRDFADNTGASRSTLRDREKMSMFFTAEDRNRYDVFSYHQFRSLRSAGENWEIWAEWAIRNSFRGRPASEKKIREAIDADRDPTVVYKKKLQRMETDCKGILIDERAPDEVKVNVEEILKILNDTKEYTNG
jgi:hypothetical protein